MNRTQDGKAGDTRAVDGREGIPHRVVCIQIQVFNLLIYYQVYTIRGEVIFGEGHVC